MITDIGFIGEILCGCFKDDLLSRVPSRCVPAIKLLIPFVQLAMGRVVWLPAGLAAAALDWNDVGFFIAGVTGLE
jgi:hypothetical protein